MTLGCDAPFARTSPFLTHPVFNRYHSETEMLRYIRRLESRDLSLTDFDDPARLLHDEAERDRGDVPGDLAGVRHDCIPFAPPTQTQGYQTMFKQLEAVAGGDHRLRRRLASAQRRFAGRIRRACWSFAHITRAAGEAHRNVCLIPTSAHGTNPASAVMAGMKVVAVACDDDGNIDLADLRSQGARASQRSRRR